MGTPTWLLWFPGVWYTRKPPDSAAAIGTGGAMLLYENAGGYVLVGVAAFAAAVVITVACIRYREKNTRKTQTKEESKE